MTAMNSWIRLGVWGALLLWAAAPHAAAQGQQSTPTDPAQQQIFIEQIVVLGNKKTRTSVILREMKSRAGHYTTREQLELDRRRIESLGLFNRVEMHLQPREKGYLLIIAVSEQWYLFPFPILFFNDRDISLKKLSYGLGVIHTNFRGRAELLQFAGWLGYNPTLSLIYNNPWIFGRRQFFIRLELLIANLVNKTYDILDQRVNEKRLGVGWSIGKRLTLHTSVSVSMFYQQVRLQPAVPGQTLDPSGLDRILRLGFSYVRDYRDLAWYPTRGSYVQVDYVKSGWPGAKYIDYGQFALDARKYIPLGAQTALAFRFAADLTHGRVPIYDRLYFGYRWRIRGHFKRRLEGEHRMLASAGLRFPLLPVRYFSMDMGKMSAYGQNLRFGISGEIFADAGTLWFQNRTDRTGMPLTSGPFGLQTRPGTWLFGAGVGLNFHLPYVNILRLEAAVNPQRQTELIVDIEVAF